MNFAAVIPMAVAVYFVNDMMQAPLLQADRGQYLRRRDLFIDLPPVVCGIIE